VLRGVGAGWVTFVNSDFGFSFPVFVGEDNTREGSAFSQVEFVRAAFPQYISRGALFDKALLRHGPDTYFFDELENVSAIGRKVFDDRFLEETGKTLLRLAMKKAAEYQMRKNSPEAGAVVGIINFITEQADTRSWETLPHAISYSRFSLPSGKQRLTLETGGSVTAQSTDIEVNIPVSGMTFLGFHSLQPLQSARTR
jgi:hypothetical protein